MDQGLEVTMPKPGEHITVQARILKYAEAIGWSRLQQRYQCIILFVLPRYGLLPGNIELHGLVQ